MKSVNTLANWLEADRQTHTHTHRQILLHMHAQGNKQKEALTVTLSILSLHVPWNEVYVTCKMGILEIDK